MFSLIELLVISSVATLTAAGASRGLNRLRQSRGSQSQTFTKLGRSGESGLPAAGTWHEPRYGKRHRISGRIEYLVGDHHYKGTLVDMSRQGWRVSGTLPVAMGTAMKIRVFLSDRVEPIVVDEAIVRWSDGLNFGIELTSLSQESATSLSEYLSSHFPPPEARAAYAISPLSYN